MIQMPNKLNQSGARLILDLLGSCFSVLDIDGGGHHYFGTTDNLSIANKMCLRGTLG